MNYRQWKKSYKKINGYNPPKRKITDPVEIVVECINLDNFMIAINRGVTRLFEMIGIVLDNGATACRGIANEFYPVFVENGMRWEVRSVVCDYGVYENGELKLITNSSRAAKKIVEILQQDELEHVRINQPERIVVMTREDHRKLHNDAFDSLADAAFIASR